MTRRWPGSVVSEIRWSPRCANRPVRPYAKIFVGGVPMIAGHDRLRALGSVTFGSAILVVMACVLWLIFRAAKWVLIPLFTGATAALLLGVLGGTDWRMTVISSNLWRCC